MFPTVVTSTFDNTGGSFEYRVGGATVTGVSFQVVTITFDAIAVGTTLIDVDIVQYGSDGGAYGVNGGANDGSIEVTGSTSVVTFSAPVFNPAFYVSCEFGIFGNPPVNPKDPPPPLEHNWKLMLRGSGLQKIDLNVVAHAVNVTDEGGSVTFTVTGPGGFVGAKTVPQPLTLGDNAEILKLALTGDTIYDLKVTVTGDPSKPRIARHYKVGAVQPSVELGINGNGVRYFEARNVLQINAGSSETGVEVVVSVDDPLGPGEVVDQASAIDYTVIDISGTEVAGPTADTLIPGSPVTIGFTRSGGFVDPYTVFTVANGHTNMVKTTGSDLGFYVKECEAEPQPFHITLSPDFAVNDVGTDHTVTATVTGTAGPGFPVDVPVSGVFVGFLVFFGGPNGGDDSATTGTCSVNIACTTDNSGQVSWTYTGSGGVGGDVIEAGFDDGSGFPNISNHVIKDWVAPTPTADARTIGFWKNHEELIAEIIASDPIGPLTVEQIVAILKDSSAKDARDALRAQNTATIPNLKNGADPFATGDDIRPTVQAARAFLFAHSEDPVTRKHADRQEALDLKDLLDEFNNSGEE